jgi:hypothetical protein
MKTADPVVQEVWHAKEAHAKAHQTLAAYVAHLRKQAKRKHAGGRVPCAPSTASTSPAETP